VCGWRGVVWGGCGGVVGLMGSWGHGVMGSWGQGVKAREEEGMGKALADKPPVAPGGVSHGTGTVGVLDQVGMVEWAV